VSAIAVRAPRAGGWGGSSSLPALAIALWIPAFSSSFFPVGNALLRVGFAGAVVAILAVHLGSRGAPAAIWRHPAWLGLTVAMLGWAIASILWAQHPDPALSEALRASLAVFVAIAIVWVVRTERDVIWLAVALACGPAISALVGLVGGESVERFAGGETFGRLAGGAGDANQLAAGLVPAVALAIGLAASHWSRAVRLVAIAVVVVALIGLGETESRGGAIGIAVIAVLGLLLLRGARGWLLGAVAFAAVAAIVATAVSPGALGRITEFEGDGTGREDLWRIAGDMSLDNPWGVGLNNFRSESRTYALDPGGLEHAQQIVSNPIVAHNTFLQMSAELGVVGLLLFVALVAASVTAAWRAGRAFDRAGEAGLAVVARASVVALVGFLAASIFVSFGFSYRMWSLLALGPALLTVAKLGEARRGQAARSP
jgi:O-antigen ligase